MEQNKMAVMPMPKLVANMSLPLMVSLLVQSLYNIVDSVFVAKMGEDALTATSLAFPVQILMIAVAVGTSVGMNAMLSQSIGAKKQEITENIAATGVILAVVGTAIFVLLGIFCSGWFVSVFTQDAVIGEYCRQYLSICMIFCGGTSVATMFQRFLQATGDTFDSMMSLVSGAVTNLILDPIFIFGFLGIPSMGVRGAAIATVIGQWVSAVVAIILNKVKNPTVPVRLKGYRPDSQVLKQIYKVGLPTIITQALGSIMLFCINGILIGFSSTAVAFFGLYYKLQSFLFMPMNGLGQAAIPIVGYNFGAKNLKRILEVFRTMLPAAIGLSLVATVVFMAIPRSLLGIFSAGDAMLEMGVPALRIISATFAFASVTIILGYGISGLGNGVINMLGTALRQVVILVPLVYAIARFFGVEYVWFAFWVSEIAACIFAVIGAGKELRKKGIR